MKTITKIHRSEVMSLKVTHEGREFEVYEFLGNHVNVRLACLAHKGNYGFGLYLGAENEGKEIITLPEIVTDSNEVEKSYKWHLERDPELSDVCHCGSPISALWIEGKKLWFHTNGSSCKPEAFPRQSFTEHEKAVK